MSSLFARPRLFARLAVFGGIVLLAGLGWAYTVLMPDMDRSTAEMEAIIESGWQPWSGLQAVFTLLMWLAMMVAMMTPSALPMLIVFERVARGRAAASPFGATALFLLGYLVLWAAFSVIATTAQAALHAFALLSLGMTSISQSLNGWLLLAAGAYQFSPLKRACLAKCRSPLGFLLAEWRSGRWGAFVMGLRHGLYCVGCCWLLMALLFVGGVMNVLWIAGLALLALLEKTLPSDRLATAVGGGLAGWGAWLLLHG